MKITLKKGLAATAVAGLTLMGLTTQIAFADETGTINVYKYTKTTGNGTVPGTGESTDKDNAVAGSAKPVEGVKFTIKKIKQTGDLSTNDQFVIADKIQKAYQSNRGISDPTELTYESSQKVQIDDSFGVSGSMEMITEKTEGKASFTGLSRGLYFVKETDVKNAKVEGKSKPVVPGESFFVTLPYGTKMTVNVYPKNQVQEPTTKTPDLSKLSDGIITYTVKAAVPAKPDNGFKKFDLLDKPGEALDIDTFKLLSVKLAVKDDHTEETVYDGSGAGITVNGGEQDAGNYLSIKKDGKGSLANKLVRISFKSPAGLSFLDTQATAGKNEIIYTYEIKIKEDKKATGAEVVNDAITVPTPDSSEDFDDNPGKGTSTTKLVAVKIFKSDQTGETPLANAKLNIYSCSAAGNNQIADSVDQDSELYTKADGTGTKKRNEAKKWNKTDLVSKAEGVKTEGNTDAVLVEAGKDYCVQEAEAPTGYMKLAQDVKFQANSEVNKVQVVEVKNYKSNFDGFKLPKTGSSAIILLSIAGGLLMSGAFILKRRNAKN